MQWRKISSFQVRQIIALIAAALGLALVFSMTQIYQLAAEPAWDSLATPITFFITTFLLGGLAMGTAFTINYLYYKGKKDCGEIEVQCDMLRSVLQWIAIGSIALLGLQLVVVPLFVSQLAAGNAAAIKSAGMLSTDYGIVFALRLLLVILGAGLFGLFLYRSALLRRERWMATFVIAAFAFVLVGELLGRFLFYAIRVRIGI